MSEETEMQDYMEKARKLADSYPQLLAKRQELKQQIDESSAWFYTREDSSICCFSSCRFASSCG